MNKGNFSRLTFLVTAAFLGLTGLLCLGIGLYWFNFVVPSIRSGEKVRAEMVVTQVTEKLEPVLEKGDKAALEDLLIRLVLMKDPSTEENLIMGIRVETLDGISLTKFSKEPVEFNGPFAFTAPLYSSVTQEVLGEVSFQYNPLFYELLVGDARTKLIWLLCLITGVIFFLQRILLRLLRPLSQFSHSLGKVDLETSAQLPEIRGWVVSEIHEVIQSMEELLVRLDSARKSERRARGEMERAQAVSHTGSWVWNIKTNALTWSEEIFRIVGLKPGEVEPDYQLFLDLVHPEDRPIVEEAVAKAVRGEQEYDIVHRLVRSDGTIRFIREKSLVSFNEEGEAVSMVGTAQDITEQKLAEDLSLRFGRIMDEAFNEIYIIDEPTLKFTRVNQSALQNIGYTMKELAAMTPHDIAPEISEAQMEALFQSMRDGTESMPVIQSVHRRKDGSDYPVEVRLQLSKHETPPQFVAIVQDITERKKAEKAMQEAMRTLETRVQERTADLERVTRENKLILHAAGEGIYGLDREGRTTFLNPAAEKTLGYSSEELIGQAHHEIYHLKRADGSPYPKHECPIYQTLRDGQNHQVSNDVFWKKDGTAVPVEYLSTPIREEGEVVGVVVTFRDISDRIKAQEKLQVSEKRFRQLFSVNPDAILIMEADTRKILDVNPAALELYGYSREEFLNLTGDDVSAEPEKTAAAMKEINKGKISHVPLRYHKKKNGTVFPLELMGGAFSVNEKRMVFEIVRDISGRKKAEEKLMKSEEKFRSYFELPLTGIAITSPDKGWLEVNDRLCEFFGYSRDELTKMTWAELTHPEDLDADVAEFNKVLEGKSEGYSMEKRFVHMNGEVIYAEISARCVRKANGEVDYFVALVQDINARKKAEQELLLAKEEAERASNAKSEFLSQMSHELRTPLNAILGFSQVMESDPEEPLTEFQEQSVKEIIKGGNHLLDLINEILDLSRIETGHLPLLLENVNLNFLTEELITLCHPMAKKNDIELLNYVPLHEDMYVFVDRVRLKQVLLNLISNAIKYNNPGGDVKIDAKENKAGGICISVADTGIGIPADRIDGLFQPFNRLGSERSEIEGTGVGLTITKRLVENMNGSIEVISRPGEGSTFSVTVPMGQAEPETQEPSPKETPRDIPQPSGRARWVVLYVEDNPANLNLVRHIFRRRPDVLLLTAPEAKLGIELAEAHRPDLILMDINLPGMDGLTAFKHLKAMEETRTVPVIAISANAMPRDIKKALESGFSDYLTKPLDVAEFNRVIEDFLKVGLRKKN